MFTKRDLEPFHSGGILEGPDSRALLHLALLGRGRTSRAPTAFEDHAIRTLLKERGVILNYGIIVSNLNDEWFFTVGPFKTKSEAKDFEADMSACNLVTSVHPWVMVENWKRRVLETPLEHLSEVELMGLMELRGTN